MIWELTFGHVREQKHNCAGGGVGQERASEREGEGERERRSDSLCVYEAQTNRNLKQKIIDISAICNNDHADDVDCAAEFIA